MGARIVVGVDGSPPARRALAWAAEEARLRQAELVVVHAHYDPVHAEQVLATAEEDLRRALEGFAPDSVRWRAVVVDGTVADALLEQSRDADLVVVGTRQEGRIASAVGSVGLALLRHAGCPVVVVPGS